ncbi:MAG: class I SAM-dependent methyltransferase [Planctomycetes bacterium]|nr:class I SAM-dependent methyltransferase [Planctomycetota bacterium]
MNKCRICSNSNSNEVYIAHEMMFDSRDPFEYFECSNCGCLQINDFPDNLSKYYPSGYVSFVKPKLPIFFFAVSFIRRQRLAYTLSEKSVSGFLFFLLFGPTSLPEWTKKTKLKPGSNILDVGCGVGRLLLKLRRKGFSNLHGIDPFIKNDIFYKCGVEILKKDMEGIDGEYDFIILHHSFEHMPNPLPVLQKLYSVLKPDSFVVIRIPTVSSFAWEKYKTNWFQLDAPRHFFLHSKKSMEILANKSGFRITDIISDSKSNQFWKSEQYAHRSKSIDGRNDKMNNDEIVFSDEEMRNFEEETKRLNKINEGDQACFYLYKE